MQPRLQDGTALGVHAVDEEFKVFDGAHWEQVVAEEQDVQLAMVQVWQT